MSYLALYRKYRPNSFDDFVGQSEVASIIKNEILTKKISHAYLFSGPRGTGKTSTAKIIARMINCSDLSEEGIPCGICDSCKNFNNNSDVVEIDAASNNGVDEIRELRDKVNLVPTFGRYKIYIIDEVHMLTTQAFNALLKTLEEPPLHVIFILATTEFHKIPVTVVSRCQKFQFLKFSIEDIVLKLNQIAVKENIVVNDDVLYEIARLSDGGLRDAINMLDQLSSFKEGELEIQDVYKLNGVISYDEFKNLLDFISKHDIISIINFLENIDKTGKSFERFIEDLISFLKDILIYKSAKIMSVNVQEKVECIKYLGGIFSVDELYYFLDFLNETSLKIRNSSFVKILIITDFIKLSNKMNNVSEKDSIERENSNQKNIDNNIVFDNNHNGNSIKKNVFSNQNKLGDNSLEINKSNDSTHTFNNEDTKKREVDKSNLGINEKTKKIRINNTFSTASKKYKEAFMSKWGLVLEEASNSFEFISIAGLLNDVEILVVGEKNIIFLAQYDSLLERLMSQIGIIENLLLDVFNIKYKIVFLLKDEWDFEKERYIANLKALKKYTYIEEDEEVKSTSSDEDVDKLVSIFGSDVIKYK